MALSQLATVWNQAPHHENRQKPCHRLRPGRLHGRVPHALTSPTTLVNMGPDRLCKQDKCQHCQGRKNVKTLENIDLSAMSAMSGVTHISAGEKPIPASKPVVRLSATMGKAGQD